MIVILILAAIIAIFVGLTLAGYWPLVFVGGKGDGANAYQNLFYIRIFDGHLTAAELAQELYEWRYRWCRPWMWFCDAGKREMELTSHEIETQAAVLIYGADEAAYRRKEADSMPVYDWLKDMASDQIEAAMIFRRPTAVGWVRANETRLRRVR